jgi:hypothetical protein
VIGQSVGPAAAFAAPAPVTPAQPQEAGAANVTTSGLHNVVESRKGDMIAPAVR